MSDLRLLVLGCAITSTMACAPAPSGTVTVYPAHCEGKVDPRINLCVGQITYQLNASRFLVDQERQQVIQQYDIPGAIPERLEACTVMDTENWSCCIRDSSGSFCRSMSGGTYEARTTPPLENFETDAVYVSSLQWWRLQSGNTISLGLALFLVTGFVADTRNLLRDRAVVAGIALLLLWGIYRNSTKTSTLGAEQIGFLVKHQRSSRAIENGVWRRVRRAIAGGWLINDEKEKGFPARLRRGAPLPKARVTALPTVEK